MASSRVTPDRASRTVPASSTMWLLAASAAWMIVLQFAVVGGLFPPIGLIQAVLYVVPLVMAWRRLRGAFVTAAVIGVIILAVNAGPIIADLSNPSRLLSFVWTVVALLLGLGVIGAAIVAAARGSRKPRTTQA
ncbi:hypothetical protein [Humibacter ginsengisoli]